MELELFADACSISTGMCTHKFSSSTPDTGNGHLKISKEWGNAHYSELKVDEHLTLCKIFGKFKTNTFLRKKKEDSGMHEYIMLFDVSDSPLSYRAGNGEGWKFDRPVVGLSVNTAILFSSASDMDICFHGNQDHRLIMICFSETWFLENVRKFSFPENKSLKELAQPGEEIFHLTEMTYQDFIYCREIWENNFTKGIEYLNIMGRILLLTSSFFNSYFLVRDANTSNIYIGDLQRMAKVKDMLVHDQMDNKVTIRKLARYAGMSDTKFKILFKKINGCTFKQFVLLRKLEKAKLLLRSNDDSISEVASELGFCNSGHFSKYFKKHYGIPPSQYARLIYSSRDIMSRAEEE